MDKLIAIKIKCDDDVYSDEIPIGVVAENVQWDDTHTLVDIIGNILNLLTAPDDDNTYTLKCSVLNGTKTYYWEGNSARVGTAVVGTAAVCAS